MDIVPFGHTITDCIIATESAESVRPDLKLSTSLGTRDSAKPPPFHGNSHVANDEKLDQASATAAYVSASLVDCKFRSWDFDFYANFRQS